MHGSDPARLFSATSARIASYHVSVPLQHPASVEYRILGLRLENCPRGACRECRGLWNWRMGGQWSSPVGFWKGGQARHRRRQCSYTACAQSALCNSVPSTFCSFRPHSRHQSIRGSIAYLIQAAAAVTRNSGPLLTSGERGAEGVLGRIAGACSPGTPPLPLLCRFDLRQF